MGIDHFLLEDHTNLVVAFQYLVIVFMNYLCSNCAIQSVWLIFLYCLTFGPNQKVALMGLEGFRFPTLTRQELRFQVK